MDTATTTITKIEQPPDWLKKILKRHVQLNKQYEKAHDEFGLAWNDFLCGIEEINSEYGTNFSAEQAMTEFNGDFAPVEDEDENDE